MIIKIKLNGLNSISLPTFTYSKSTTDVQEQSVALKLLN